MIRVQTEDFDLNREVAALTAEQPEIGAVVTFTGLVRDLPDAPDRLLAMTLEHYPGMTERALDAIEAEARDRFDITASLIIHRVGRLLPMDRIVLVATASRHRQAAFDAATFLMDFLKTRAPFWKREETTTGARWVEARSSDEAATQRWSS